MIAQVAAAVALAAACWELTRRQKAEGQSQRVTVFAGER
jgi:hypothetical protein